PAPTPSANDHGLPLRAWHHCNQPLMGKLRVPGTNRASFYFYNTEAEIDRMIDVLRQAHRFFSREDTGISRMNGPQMARMTRMEIRQDRVDFRHGYRALGTKRPPGHDINV